MCLLGPNLSEPPYLLVPNFAETYILLVANIGGPTFLGSDPFRPLHLFRFELLRSSPPVYQGIHGERYADRPSYHWYG